MLQTERQVLLSQLAVNTGQATNYFDNFQAAMFIDKMQKKFQDEITTHNSAKVQKSKQQEQSQSCLSDGYMPRPIRKLAQDVHTMTVVLNQPVVVLTPEDFFPQLHSHTTSSSSIEPPLEADIQHDFLPQQQQPQQQQSHQKITYYKRSGQSSPPPEIQHFQYVQNAANFPNVKNIDYVNSSMDLQSVGYVGYAQNVRNVGDAGNVHGEGQVVRRKRRGSLKIVKQFVKQVWNVYKKKSRTSNSVVEMREQRSGEIRRCKTQSISGTFLQGTQKFSPEISRDTRRQVRDDGFNYATWSWSSKNSRS